MSTNSLATWSFIRNPFESATRNSYSTMKKIGDYTLFAIQGRIPDPAFAAKGAAAKGMLASFDEVDPGMFFNELKILLKPLVDDFTTKYKAWINQQGTRKGSSSTLAEKLQLLSGLQIKRWDALIQTVYVQGTPEYEAILPERRTPF